MHSAYLLSTLCAVGALALSPPPFDALIIPDGAAGAHTLLLTACSATAQKWTVNGGAIGVIAPSPNSDSNCLCAPATGASGPLTVEKCEGSGAPLHPFEVGFNFSGAVGPLRHRDRREGRAPAAALLGRRQPALAA